MTLYDGYGKIALSVDTNKEINRGGEGTLYEHPKDSHQVIKVYHQRGNLSLQTLQELMVLPDNFIKPLELFYDKQGFLKGLSMKYLDTHKLHLLATIFSKPTATKAGFTEKVKQDIYAGMIASMIQAHKLGIVIGDFNPYNIFVSNKAEVYFIDVDSFQTKSRPHSGVMLPEIRDWLYNHIDDKSDYYALSVMVFQMFTHLHPYKGIHRKVQKFEDRVIRKISVLSNDPDLVIPAFYEPFSDRRVTDQFIKIFQDAERFVPNVSGGVYTNAHVPVGKVSSFIQAIKEGELTVRTINLDVEDFDATDSFFYTRKDTDTFTIYRSTGPGAYAKHHVSTKAEGCILGNTNVVITRYSKLYNCTQQGEEEVKNFLIPSGSFGHTSNGKSIYFDSGSDSFIIIAVDQILNGHISSTMGSIYTKSVVVQTGIVQTVVGSKFIIDISLGHMTTLRTATNATDVYLCPSGKYGVIESKLGSQVEHFLFAVKGMRVELGPKLNGMCIIAERGDHLYIPTNGAMDVYRKSDLAKIATIACRFVTEQSVLRICNSGILCLTAGTLYLFNKS